MTKAKTRRLALTAVALSATLGLSACGTGLETQTNALYQASVGADSRDGKFQLYNAFLVANESGTFTLTAGILNTTDTPAQLTGYSIAPLSPNVEGTEDRSETATPVNGRPDEPIELPSKNLKTIGYDGEIITRVPGLVDGAYAEVTLTFSDGSTSRVEAPSFPRNNTPELEQIASAPAPAPATPTVGLANPADPSSDPTVEQ